MERAGATLPKSATFRDTLGVMVAGSWLFAYSYCITFIAGEVKRPDKTIILANLMAVLVPAFFMIWLAVALYHSVGFEFLSASAYVDNAITNGNAFAGYALPGLPISLAGCVLTRNPLILILMGISFILFNIWYVALSYMAFPRILFAWAWINGA